MVADRGMISAKTITTRTHVTGQVGNAFKAADIALPLNLDEQPAS